MTTRLAVNVATIVSHHKEMIVGDVSEINEVRMCAYSNSRSLPLICKFKWLVKFTFEPRVTL